MIRVILAAAVTIAAAAAVQAGNPGHMIGPELRKAVAGKTVYLKTSGIVLPIAYRPNGTMSGQLQAFAAAFSGDRPVTDKGKWWIDGNRLCQRWSQWLDGRSYCYKLTRDGQTVRWQRNDGRRGTARIGR